MRIGLVLLVAIACAKAELPAPHRGIGLAVSDTTGAWCAAFPSDSARRIEPGTRATIIVPTDSGATTKAVRIGAARSVPCETAFPQPRWSSYTAFSLEPVDAVSVVSIVGLLAIGEVRVTHTDGETRADIDGDGTEETIRRCAADEGEHFTVWSPPRDGVRARRWHEYFDWGAIVDPTCKAGEDGRDVAR